MTLSLCREKRKIAVAFGRAARHYDTIAYYQQATGNQLLTQLTAALSSEQRTAPLHILDAGCGTGYFSQKLTQQGYQVTALDLSVGMLDEAKAKSAADCYLCADMEAIPLEDQSVDAVFSNLAIQWCPDMTRVLSELYRVTKRGGIVVFSTLGKHSLAELSAAWKALDDAPHVNTFVSFTQMNDCCRMWRNQLTLQKDTLYFSGISELLHSLKGIGATHLTAGRRAGLMTRQRLQQLALAYPMTDRGLPLTYQTVFGVLYRD